EVICVDKDLKKVENLKKGVIPIYEPGLEDLVKRNYKKKTLHFTSTLKTAINKAEVAFIAVGTPMGEDGSADLKYVLNVATEIGQEMSNSMVVVDKSTVPVGTADKVKATIQKELDLRGKKTKFHVVSNPEFLKEGAAVEDFIKPDRVVVGADDDEALNKMRQLYAPFFRNHDRFIGMDLRSAEMTKYAANAMLATKISFMNEIANICERVGADVNKVRIGIGSDRRIGYSFIYPGCGYGGSCFPKDVNALINTANSVGYHPELITAVDAVNQRQKQVIVQKVIARFGEDLSGKIFALWGLSFKPETDDMRDAASIVIVEELTKRGAKISAYDPKAITEAKEYYFKNNTNITYAEQKYAVVENADALILLTEWKEFRSPDFEKLREQLKNAVIFDGRNQYNPCHLKEIEFEYFQIGV
ncbi:MAG: UDP-glucose/GDP-mannose dehydrogenase family protein, partial [Flavobacteriales bacterium]|nr:UDP-glucose/GDP-mannose dehydrogenase family protein [Flavobacteriales bacterium]